MANQEHLNIVKQSVTEWNHWRNDNPDIRPDLSGANLAGLNLAGVNFRRVNLSGADLSKSFLRGADLEKANLSDANLSDSYLGGANLKGASLENANLRRADLEGADLTGANLKNIRLEEANLEGANLKGTELDQDIKAADYPVIDYAMDDMTGIDETAEEETALESYKRSKKRPAPRKKAAGETKKLFKSIKASEEPKDFTYPVWYGTNRRPIDASDFAKGFSNEREKIQVVHYGKCEVHIPAYHKIGSLGSSWIKQLFTGKDQPLKIVSRQALTEILFWEGVKTAINLLQKSNRTALIFIHGYNTSFDEAALRAAQLGVDLKVPVTAFYSWPSKGDLFDYAADAASVEASEIYVKEFLLRFAEQSGAESINIIAHSMGNRVFLRAVHEAAEENPDISFNQIFLAAPDIDTDTFIQLAEVYPAISKRTTLYCSSQDKALKVSGALHDYARAGLVPPITIVSGIDTIESSNVDFSKLGHGYYAAARDVLQDMHTLLQEDAPPDERFGLSPVQAAAGMYWTFRS